MKRFLIIIVVLFAASCGKEPTPTPDKTPEVVVVEDMSVMDLVTEAKKLGIEGREIDKALDESKQALYDLIQEKK